MAENDPEDQNGQSDKTGDKKKLYKIDFSKIVIPKDKLLNDKGNFKYGDTGNDNAHDDRQATSGAPPEPPHNTGSPEKPYFANSWFSIHPDELKRLFAFRKNPEARNRAIVFLIGVLFTIISVIGALIGFIRAYNRFGRPYGKEPRLHPMHPVTRVAMGLGIAAAWVITLSILFAYYKIIGMLGYRSAAFFGYLAINTLLTAIAMAGFYRWQVKIYSHMDESEKFGSARFAQSYELLPFQNTDGFYIGQGLAFKDKGNLITVGGTRGGKGTNILIPALLDASLIETSWVVIDPKGENAAITANYRRKKGQNVVILNPWDLLSEHTGEAQNYNPLDMLDVNSAHLVDDIQVIAEMIVPIEHDAKDRFWTDSARTIVSGMLLHMLTCREGYKPALKELWEFVRCLPADWDKIILEMGISTHPQHGLNIANAGLEILKLQSAGEETFGGIMSSVLQATDFLKSPALQKSLESGFDPKVLAEGKTTVYVIIPADKLKSHYRWLRLVVTSMMRAVIRKPEKRVTFLLDEFAALGYLPEIETALSAYAGYNVTVWPILQSLIQLKNLYKDNWETFIANCTVRQYFTINDNFSAEYISKAIGETSNITMKNDEATANARRLITPDELRRASGKEIFMFIGDLPPTYVPKLPYYLVPELNGRADKNPYIS